MDIHSKLPGISYDNFELERSKQEKLHAFVYVEPAFPVNMESQRSSARMK